MIRLQNIKVVAILVLSILFIVIGRLEFLINPELFREDLWIFSSQRSSLMAFITPYNGYYHLIPRIIAFLTDSPLLYSWISFGITCIVFINILSSRIKLNDDIKCVMMFSLAIVSITYSEILFSISYLQWILAVALIMLFIKEYPKTKWQSIGDNLLVLFVGLSSVFAIILIPLYILCRRDLLVTVCISTTIQLIGITSIPPFTHSVDIVHYIFIVPHRTIGQMLGISNLLIYMNVLYYVILLSFMYYGRKVKEVSIFIAIHFLFLIAALFRLSENFFMVDWFGGGDRYFFIPSLMLFWSGALTYGEIGKERLKIMLF
jgi:hypothetical protein